jgi:hypothetical protein
LKYSVSNCTVEAVEIKLDPNEHPDYMPKTRRRISFATDSAGGFVDHDRVRRCDCTARWHGMAWQPH